MELTAVIESLPRIPENSTAAVYSDSAYVINGITSHIKTWRKNGFLTVAKKPVENQDLWEELDRLSGSHVRYVKVEGHAGNAENERANEIAQAFSKGKKISLVCGKDEVDAEDETGAPVEVPRHIVFPTYVLCRQNRLSFFRAWDECKSAIGHGRNLRYKKCKSPEELRFTLAKWGLRAMT